MTKGGREATSLTRKQTSTIRLRLFKDEFLPFYHVFFYMKPAFGDF